MKNSKNLDRRIRKTQQALRDALITLLSEKDIHSITIQDITSLADVNRATFYFHYQDKYDFIQKISEDVLHEFEEIIQQFMENNPPPVTDLQYPEALFVSIFEHIRQQADFYRVMLCRRSYPEFWRKLLGIVKNTIKQRRTQLIPDESQLIVPHDIMISYFSSAFLGVVMNWIENDMNYTPEYMAQKLAFIFSKQLPPTAKTEQSQ